MTTIRIAAALAATAAIGWAPHAEALPCVCYQPAHMYDSLCAGRQFNLPPGYNVDDPGTWSPWPEYSPCAYGTPCGKP